MDEGLGEVGYTYAETEECRDDTDSGRDKLDGEGGKDCNSDTDENDSSAATCLVLDTTTADASDWSIAAYARTTSGEGDRDDGWEDDSGGSGSSSTG